MISAPSARTCSAVSPVTVARVPTGMKAGVSTAPCAVTKRPRRARVVASSAPGWKEKLIWAADHTPNPLSLVEPAGGECDRWLGAGVDLPAVLGNGLPDAVGRSAAQRARPEHAQACRARAWSAGERFCAALRVQPADVLTTQSARRPGLRSGGKPTPAPRSAEGVAELGPGNERQRSSGSVSTHDAC